MANACTTLAEALHAAGYRTGAVVANPWYLQKMFQFDQGFEYYDDRGGTLPAPYRPATVIADEALRWLEQNAGQPFFLFLNFVDPHAPYNPPAPYDTRFSQEPPAGKSRGSNNATSGAKPGGMELWLEVHDRVLTEGASLSPAEDWLFRNQYDGEIAYMDAEIGRVLAWLRERGLYERTLVAITADHGEAFGEHAAIGHALTLYEPEVAVPMILKLPASEQRGTIDYPVHHVDIMPTLLDVLGLAVPEEVQGTSMLAKGTRELVIEEYANNEKGPRWPRFNRIQRAIYRAGLKYIEYSDGQAELYDLDRDPSELEDLALARPGDVESLQASLKSWNQRTTPLDPGEQGVQFDPEHLQRLRDLGYAQ
jgi:arylsulfatase A-like enzyme